MNTPEQFTEHVHDVQFSSCSVHLFLADHEHPPLCSCSVHVQFTPPPRSDFYFIQIPEGQTTNVLFLEILTRATPHASCIHLSRARTSALHPSPSLSRAHSAPSDQTTHTCTSIQTSTVSGSLHAVPPRCSTARIHLSRAYSVLLRSPAHIHVCHLADPICNLKRKRNLQPAERESLLSCKRGVNLQI